MVDLDTALAQKPHVALFSAGGALSLEWAPKFAAAGTTVVDNSSTWRMSDDHKLVVPEVNGDVVGAEDLILANPNCTTMQLVMCLKPIHDKWGIDRGVVSTYQSVTGTGQAAVDQLNGERAGLDPERVYPHAIDQNCLPHCDVFLDNGYTKEEMKVHQETKKSWVTRPSACRAPRCGCPSWEATASRCIWNWRATWIWTRCALRGRRSRAWLCKTLRTTTTTPCPAMPKGRMRSLWAGCERT